MGNRAALGLLKNIVTVEMLRPVFVKAMKYWSSDQASRLAAALTFYLMLSLSPLLLFIVGLGSLLLQTRNEQNPVATQLIDTISHTMGQAQGQFLSGMIAAHSRGAGYLGIGIGLLVLIYGASGLFQQARYSVNTIWRVESKETGIKGFLWSKAVSILMVLVVGAILIAWLIFDWWLRLVQHSLHNQGGLPVRETVSFLLSWAFWTPIYAAIFKWLPERRVEWRDVWLGGICTSLFYAISKYLLSLYFTNSSISVNYGSAGAIIVILLWAYYYSQIFFYGVELTRAYAEQFGSLKGVGSDGGGLDQGPETQKPDKAGQVSHP